MKLSRVQFTSAARLGHATDSQLASHRDGRQAWHLDLEPETKDHCERVRILPVGGKPSEADYVPIHQVLSYRVATAAEK